MPKRLGFFTRLLDQGSAQTRYRLAAEQIRHAERFGFDSAWIAQHHFHEQEGGLPSPLVFLAHVAAQTDHPPRHGHYHLADGKSAARRRRRGGAGFTHRRRLEGGFRRHANLILPFGLTSEQRGAVFADHLHLIHSAWRGDTLSHPDNLSAAPQLAERIWIATFSVEGAIRAGQAGHGLMLSRTQPGRPASHVCRWTPFRTRSSTPTWRRCRTALRRGSSPRAPPSSPTVTPTPCRSPNPACANRRHSTGRRVIDRR
jgi:alkanesulfonate monooxygenase SsuD/methylene tetrahydromethanopterin reductase-like flavin-dependent oxidoreductase (luciferase family)